MRRKELSADQFISERKAQAQPVLEKFKEWLEKRSLQVPPSLLLGKAIRYTLNEWPQLVRYLESPHLSPDNNVAEQAIRPFVVGRKNWLFSGSPKGAESSCAMYSLIETAKQNSVNPNDYLRKVFELAPSARTSEDWKALLPLEILSNVVDEKSAESSNLRGILHKVPVFAEASLNYFRNKPVPLHLFPGFLRFTA